MSDEGTLTPTPGAPAAQVHFSERDVKLMAAAFQCQKAATDVDIPRLMQLMGYTNSGSARNALTTLRKKIAAATPEGSDPLPPVTPKKAGRKKGGSAATPAAAVKREDGEVEDDDATPVPKRAGRKRKVLLTPGIGAEEGELGGGEGAPKQTPRKRAKAATGGATPKRQKTVVAATGTGKFKSKEMVTSDDEMDEPSATHDHHDAEAAEPGPLRKMIAVKTEVEEDVV